MVPVPTATCKRGKKHSRSVVVVPSTAPHIAVKGTLLPQQAPSGVTGRQALRPHSMLPGLGLTGPTVACRHLFITAPETGLDDTWPDTGRQPRKKK